MRLPLGSQRVNLASLTMLELMVHEWCSAHSEFHCSVDLGPHGVLWITSCVPTNISPQIHIGWDVINSASGLIVVVRNAYYT